MMAATMGGLRTYLGVLFIFFFVFLCDSGTKIQAHILHIINAKILVKISDASSGRLFLTSVKKSDKNDN